MEAKEFIAALIARGLTQSQIADRTGIPQPTLSKVARGEVADVLSRNYRKLQSLHAEVCGPEPAAIAREEPAPSSAGEPRTDPYRDRTEKTVERLKRAVAGPHRRSTDKPGASGSPDRGGR